MSVVRALIAPVIMVGFVLLTGCVHTTRIESEPPGASVYVDNELAGTTPLVYKERPSGVGSTRVEVRHDGRAARFDLVRDGFSPLAVTGSAGVGAILLGMSALSTAGFLMSYVTTVLALVGGIFPTAPGGPVLAVAGTAGAAVGFYTMAYALALSAPLVVLLLVGEGSRVGPDTVRVDFEAGDIEASPPDLVVPLVGASAGYRPVWSGVELEE